MPRRKRTTPGLLTVVGPQLRIINGDVKSLRGIRRPGRPKKYETLFPITPSTPDYPTYDDLQEWEGFHAVRSRKIKQAKTAANKSMQARFDELASEVVVYDYSSGVWQSAPGKVGRIEKSVPGSFCSCYDRGEDSMPCLIHGTKLDDCACAGIDGLTGYRWCRGHRGVGNG